MPEANGRPDEDVALLRYLVVTQVCAAVIAGQSKSAAIKEVASRPQMGLRGRVWHIGERTLWRWLAAWQAAGFHGLAQAPREPPPSGLPLRFSSFCRKPKQNGRRPRSRR